MPGKPKRRDGRGVFRKVHVCVYADEKFRELSKPPPNAKYLFLYLLTFTAWSFPGLIAIGEAALAESLGWPLAAFRKVFAELSDHRMALADWSARLVWLPNAIKYNEPENANVIRGWAKRIGDIPECELKGYRKGSGNGYQNRPAIVHRTVWVTVRVTVGVTKSMSMSMSMMIPQTPLPRRLASSTRNSRTTPRCGRQASNRNSPG
jgi:hypothetical protein